MHTAQEILDRIAECDKFLKKNKDPRTGEGLWQMNYEARGRYVHELRRRTEHCKGKDQKDAIAALKKVKA